MIEFQSVSKKYSSDAFALRDVSLNIGKGELVFLAGPSGAGKSTLLKMIAAIERPSSGRVTVNGQDIGKLKRAGVPFLRRNLGLILQQQRLLTDRTILANVMLSLLVTGASKSQAEQRARAALDKVGLLDRAHALPMELSGGEQQRVAIARAIVKRPEVLLCDEPTGALDYQTGKLVLEVIARINVEIGTTAVVITHNAAIAGMADRVVYLGDGRIQRVEANPHKISPSELTW